VERLSYDLRRRYGISLRDYQRMEAEQGGRCAICGGLPQGGNTSTSRLCVDHHHATGRVRGLLCHLCNSAIGYLGESLERMEAAKNYVVTTMSGRTP
jgi:hypothetical protein